MLPLAWTLALGLLSLSPLGCCASGSSLRHSVSQVAAPAPSRKPDSEALKAARESFARARDARDHKDLDEARTQAAGAIGALLGLAPGSFSPTEDQLLFTIGAFSREVGDLKSARLAHERVVLEREHRLPPDHPELAQARRILATTLFALGDVEASRALFERVLEDLERTLPDDHPDLSAARGNLALTLRSLGDLQAARAIQERVLEVAERNLPDDHPDLAKARLNLAATLFTLGETQAARALFERVLMVLERTLPADHPDLAATRQGLAGTLFTLGDPEAARALDEQVVEVRERTLPSDHPDLAEARLNLGSTLFTLGDLHAARALFERVLEVRERTLPDDHPGLAVVRGNLANTLSSLGDLQAARALEERVLEVFQRTLPDDHPDLAWAQENLAGTLKTLGDSQAARALQERVLELRERTLPADHPDLTRVRGNLANTLSNLGDLHGAFALQEQVLGVLERTLTSDHPDLQWARASLARTHFTQGELEAARALQEHVLEVLERRLSADHPDLALARQNLASTLGGLLGEMEEGRREEEKIALRTLAQDLSHGLRRSAQSALMLSSPREVEERLASKEAAIGHAYSLARGYGIVDLGHEVQGESFLLGELCRAGGLIATRLTAHAGKDEVGRALRARIAVETETLARLAQSGASAEELGQVRTAIDRAGRDLAQHASELLGGAAVIDPTLEDLSRNLGPRDGLVAWRRITYVRIQRGDPATWSSVDSLVAFVVRPGVRIDGLVAAEQDPSLEFIDLGPAAPIEVAIERWRGRLGTAIERGVAPDDRGVGVNGRELAPDSAGPSLLELGREVRARVLDPLHGALAGVDRVIVVLDDALHAIPLDELPAGDAWAKEVADVEASKEGGASPRPLGDVLRIEVRSSLIELLLPEEPLPGETTLLAIGDPAFDAESASTEDPPEETSVLAATATRSGEDAGLLRGGVWERGFGTLPGTRAEVRGIAQHFEDSFGEKAPSLLLEHRRASREGLIELAPKARWLHVATHGWVAPESVRSSSDPQPETTDSLAGLRLDESERVRGMSPMLLCGLALAGANLPVNAVGRIPGLVTAQEIAALDLSNCELAVLSACDTNVGVRRAGQGVASLQKALHMAGARSVITSLWEVPDEATKDLMIDFYRRLWIEKKPKHQALWEAKTKLRNGKDESGKQKYTTRDWAAWVLTGNPD